MRWPASDVVVAALVPSDEAGRTPNDVGEPWATVSGTLGAQFLAWETATAVAGRMLGINPFDQPDVESAKKAARGLLDARPEDEPAQVTEGGIEARGSAGLLDGVDTIAGAIDALLGRLGPDGYLAVMAYLDSERDAALHGVRDTLSRRTERPDHLRLGTALPALHRPVPQGWPAAGRLPADHLRRGGRRARSPTGRSRSAP